MRCSERKRWPEPEHAVRAGRNWSGGVHLTLPSPYRRGFHGEVPRPTISPCHLYQTSRCSEARGKPSSYRRGVCVEHAALIRAITASRSSSTSSLRKRISMKPWRSISSVRAAS